MVTLKLLFVLAASSVVAAWPEPTPAAYLDQRAVNCAKVTGALSVLKKLGPPATSFCSSYLKIPGTLTSTTTVTPATVTSTTSTQTVTTTRLQCGQQKRNVPLDYRSFEYARPAKQLDNRGVNILPLLAAFAAAKVSEGCSCLGIQPKATVTATSFAATPTTNVVATTTTCVVEAPVCVPSGGSCDLADPGACCNFICANDAAGPYCL